MESYVLGESMLQNADLPQILQLYITSDFYRKQFSTDSSRYILQKEFGIDSLEDASGVTRILRKRASEGNINFANRRRN